MDVVPDILGGGLASELLHYRVNHSAGCRQGKARCDMAANAGLEVYEYEPRRMKKAICGNGLAEKEQIQRMVKTLLNLAEPPQNDAADALGLAICHAHSNSVISRERPI